MKNPLLSTTHTLSNGEFSSFLTLGGNGYLTARDCFLTSHRPSTDDGLFFFIRHLTSKRTWSATFAPTHVIPESYELRASTRHATYNRQDGTIHTTLDILLPKEGAFEIRRLSLENLGDTAETFEITSYADVILLYDRYRDTDHQTFSNMFIGAEFRKTLNALVYHRRYFDDPERFPFFMHRILFDHHAEFSGFETDRESFFGRGKLLEHPIGLERPLRNTSGYILDPLASLRIRMTVPAKQRISLFSVNSAHFSPEQPETFAERFPDFPALETLFNDELSNIDTTPESYSTHSLDTSSLHAFREVCPIPEVSPDIDTASLSFWNGFGGFDSKTHDYVMDIRPDDLPPQPWANIIANPHFGTMVTENALGATWFKNSRNGRLSPWSNNPVTDPPAEILYIRRNDTRDIWSLTPSPIPASSRYRVTHGTGFTRYESHRGSLRHTLTVSVDPEQPIKFFAIELANTSNEAVSLSLATLIDTPRDKDGSLAEKSLPPTLTENGHAFILDPEFFCPDAKNRIFAALVGTIPFENASFDRRALFGDTGSLCCPVRWQTQSVTPNTPETTDNLSAITECTFSLAPGETKHILLKLIAAETDAICNQLIRKALDMSDTASESHFTPDTPRSEWNKRFPYPTVTTPHDPSLEILFNTWLPYQTVSSRLWSKMGFYQPGGAYGFRDQLQDALARIYSDTPFTRSHILSAASEQYEDGNVRVWWFPDSDFGVRSKTSDNPLWLPFAVDRYIRQTGDKGILHENAPFLAFSPEDQSLFDVGPAKHRETPVTLLEHCQRAIEYTLVFGQHGLPLIREGDWNDGFNRIGREGRGESVWLGFFLASILKRFANIFEEEHDPQTATRYRDILEKLHTALDTDAWDGHWFRRAFYDDGTPLGSETNEECRIDAIAQSWSILSGMASDEKSREAMENLERFLYDPEARILKLLDPPFNDLTKRNPGYIKDYPPGIRENGSQYNHAVFWAVEAFAKLGRSDMVRELLLAANPIRRSESERKARLYEVEPYAVAADIYSAEHRGKGGWTWYTASAGLMYRTIIETLFGIEIENDRVAIHPALPAEWTECSIRLPWKGKSYTFQFTATNGHNNTLRHITCDNMPITPDQDGYYSLAQDGREHVYTICLQ